MSNIVPFQFETHAVRIHVDDAGNPWWEAQDICTILGISDVSKAIARIRSKEKRSGSRNLLIINESGLYRLIMRSNKPDAERFQDWVFEEVLPAIRKTGQYGIMAPQVKNPAHQMLIEAIVRLDAVEQQAARAQVEAAQATQRAIVAETKADLALEDAHRLTLEEFILKNGLVRQFPQAQYLHYSHWLTTFCRTYGLAIQKVPVYGKSWAHENAYPLAALGAWLRYEMHKPRQVSLVHPEAV